MLWVFRFIGFLAAMEVDTLFICRLDDSVDQIANDLMTR
jgi:hypothetical protein